MTGLLNPSSLYMDILLKGRDPRQGKVQSMFQYYVDFCLQWLFVTNSRVLLAFLVAEESLVGVFLIYF